MKMGNNIWMQINVILMGLGLLALVSFALGQGLTVSITTTPLSPPYQAATWIYFACHSSGLSVTYNWTVYCAYNQPPDQPKLVSQFTGNTNLGVETLRLRSTSKKCIDTVVCTARDSSGDTGEYTWTNGTVTGIGFWGNGLPIENNSALVADSSGQIGTLYCHSSSNANNAGQWFSPDGFDITYNSADSFEIEFFNADGYPSFSTIDVLGGHQFTTSDQGAYSCTAPDNNGMNQTAVIWIYPNDFQGSLQFSHVCRSAVSPLTLTCDTTGLPATLVTWTKGSSMLSNGPVYKMQQTHTRKDIPDYTNELVINQPIQEASGIYSCKVVNSLHEPTQDKEIGPEVSAVKHFFGVYTVGSSKSVTCFFNGAQLIRWEDPDGSVITEDSKLEFVTNDSIHDELFVCHGYGNSGNLVGEILFKVIVNVPDSTLVAMAASTEPDVILGREYSVTCLAAITANSHALQYSPMPSFNYENGTMISNGTNSIRVQGPVIVSSSAREVELVFDLLKTSHAGRYICRASLDSPALDETLIKEDVFQINIQVPSPVFVTVSTSHPPPYFAGSTITLTCEAMASSLIDVSINTVFSWTRNEEVISGDNHVTITPATSSTTEYQSILTITQLNHETDTGSYQCSALFEPVSPAQYLSPSQTEISSSLNVNIQVQSLLVSVNPTEIAVLDVPPHNVISINCLATDQDDTTVGTKSFTWTKQDTNTLITTTLQHNGGSVSIAIRDTRETTSSSVLTTTETQAATYMYTCWSTQMTLDGTTILASGSARATVNVKGPSDPDQPSGLSATVLGFSSARIEWTVSAISYTQETYSVVYGLNQQQLDSSSTAIAGTSDLSAINQVYSTNLTGLEEGRMYYYRVQSMNTVGRVTESDIDFFEIEDSPIVTSLYVSDPSFPPIAGLTFTLICESVEQVSTEGLPAISWLDAQGDPVFSDGTITVFTSQQNGTQFLSNLEFKPLKASSGQEYTCEINYSNIGLVKTHSYDLQVIVQTIPVRVLTSNTAFLAAHPQQLTCEVDQGQSGQGIVQPIGDITYTWTSTCTGSCFVNGQNNQSISTNALRAVDSGVHTCSVVDSVGNIGNGSIEIDVTGVGMYSPLVGVVSNNSLIVATNGGLDTIYCISGSTQTEVGRWTAPNGEDLNEPGGHPFTVVQGGTNNPGVLEISLSPQGRFSSSEWLGVYSCVIPDNDNINRIIHVGIHTSTPPAVSILSSEASSSSLYPVFIVNCTSTGSVATTVNWFKSGQLLTSGILYEMVQILRDGVTSTYDNLLLVHSPIINELTGEYSCEVSNSITGSPAVRDTVLRGLSFSNHGIIELGSTASITCSSDLGVSSIEWLYNGQVIESAEGAEAVLVIEVVSDLLHDRDYTCRSRARFGNEERAFRIQVEADADDLSINITPSKSQPQANQPFSLTCTIVKAIGLSSTPSIEWYAMGNQLALAGSSLSGGVSIETDIGGGPTYSSTLSFSNLDVSHSGEFICRSQVMTPAIPGMINKTAEWDLIVTDHTTQTPNTTTSPEMCTKVFQLLLSEVHDCQSYRFTDQESKISSIIDSVVGSVNELRFDVCTSCQQLTTDEIVQPTFDCDSRFPSSVLFRAKITGNGTCKEIVTAIANWVSSGRAAITVNFNTLRASEDCVVEIDSVDALFPQCDTQVTDPTINPGQTQGDVALSVGAAMGVMIAVVLSVSTAVIIAVIFLKRKKTRSVSIPSVHNSFQNPGYSVENRRTNTRKKSTESDNYMPMHDATFDLYNYSTEKAGNNEQLYAEIPANYNGGVEHKSSVGNYVVRREEDEKPDFDVKNDAYGSRDELLNSIDATDDYMPMHSSTFNFSDFIEEKAGKNEQLYAEIPANINPGDGHCESPVAIYALCSEEEII